MGIEENGLSNGAIQINPLEVKKSLDYIKEETGKISNLFKKIGSDYLAGAKIVWDTPTAERDVLNPVTTALNDYIRQYNEKMQQGFDDFTEAANYLFVGQGLNSVQASIEKINSLDKGWNAPSSPPYNVTKDFVAHTEEHLARNIGDINNSLEQIGKYVDAAVLNGLSNSFCTGIRDGIHELITSGTDVITKYGKSFIEKARNNDEEIKKASNT